jgi:hypothetical protein
MNPASYINPSHPVLGRPAAASQPPIAPTPVETAPIADHNPAPTPTPVVRVAAVEPPAKPAAPAPVVSASTVATAKPAALPAPAPAHPVVVSQASWLARSFGGLHGSSWLVGVACLLVVGVTLMALFSRRPQNRVSLISQTMNK